MAGDVSIKDLELLALNYLVTVPKRKTERPVAIEALQVTTMGRYPTLHYTTLHISPLTYISISAPFDNLSFSLLYLSFVEENSWACISPTQTNALWGTWQDPPLTTGESSRTAPTSLIC